MVLKCQKHVCVYSTAAITSWAVFIPPYSFDVPISIADIFLFFFLLDTNYQDQLGPLQERPKTQGRRLMNHESDELDITDDLLPL